MVHDTYGTWGMSTSVETQEEAHAIVKHNGAVGLHHMADPQLQRQDDRDLIYIVLDRGRQMQVHQRTGAGGRTSWTIAVEDNWFVHRVGVTHPHRLAIEQGTR